MRTKPYFEGWYFKHQSDTLTLALIPGISIEKNGMKKAFIQIITDSTSHFVEYDINEFKFKRDSVKIKIGKNYFSKKGIHLDIDSPSISIKGDLRYGSFTPLSKNIMGPFARLGRMECSHGILSMFHNVLGSITINNKTFCFQPGIGYAEKDWGYSFPKQYTWSQSTLSTSLANGHSRSDVLSVMAAAAQIPIGPFHFKGCISAISYYGKEYLFASYHGARIKRADENGIELIQGRYYLKITRLSSNAKPLMAPSLGRMDCIIHEHASCKVKCELYEQNRLLFQFTSDQGGYEHRA